MNRVEMLEELVAPMEAVTKEFGGIVPNEEILKTFDHIYLSAIANALCNISDKMDELVKDHAKEQPNEEGQ